MPAVDRRLLEQKLPPLELWRRYFEDYFPTAAPLPLGGFIAVIHYCYSCYYYYYFYYYYYYMGYYR